MPADSGFRDGALAGVLQAGPIISMPRANYCRSDRPHSSEKSLGFRSSGSSLESFPEPVCLYESSRNLVLS